MEYEEVFLQRFADIQAERPLTIAEEAYLRVYKRRIEY